jgi:hypothetical protein
VPASLVTGPLSNSQIIGAPGFFPTVWSWIKRWFDPITVSKIFILSQQDMKPTLEKYIAPENIPRKYGGTLDYEFGMLPVLEPAIRDVFVPASASDPTVPAGPIKWKENAAGELELLAVGSENGARRDAVVGKIKGDFGFMYGISRANTQIDWAEENVLSTTGTATQPLEDGDPELGRELLDGGSGAQTPANGDVEAGGRVVPVVVGGAGETAAAVPASTDEAGAVAAVAVEEQATSAEAVEADAARPVADLETGSGTAVAAPRQAEEHRAPDAAGSTTYVEQAKDAVTAAA